MRYPRAESRSRTRADLVALLVLLSCGAAVWTLESDTRMAVARGLRETVLWPFLQLHRTFEERSRLTETARSLRVERDSLVGELVRLRQLADEGRELRRAFDLGLLTTGSFLAADLVPGRPRVGDSDAFELRAPGLGAVEPPAGVYAGDGLVGVLRAVRRGTGSGQFWTHPDFRVSVRTADGSTTGIVRSVRRDEEQPVMMLEGAPYQEEISEGTVLLTTGLAGIHPAGVRVGTVESLSRVESGWARSYYVRPAVRPEAADFVVVWRRAGATSPPGSPARAAAAPEEAGAASGDTAEPADTAPPADGADDTAAPADTSARGEGGPGGVTTEARGGAG